MRRKLILFASLALAVGMVLTMGCSAGSGAAVVEDKVRYFDLFGAADGYVYYATNTSYESGAIYRMREGGWAESEDEPEIVVEAPILGVFLILDGWIYYNRESADEYYAPDMYRVRPDGSDNQIFCQGAFSQAAYTDGWIYFIHRPPVPPPTDVSGSIAKIRPDGSDFTVIIDPYEWSDLILSDGFVYYGIWEMGFDNDGNYTYQESSINKADLTTGEITVLSHVPFGNPEASGGADVRGVYDGWVYYYDYNEGIRRVRTDGSENQKVDNRPIYDDGTWFYFSSQVMVYEQGSGGDMPYEFGDELELYRTNRDGDTEDLYRGPDFGSNNIIITAAGIYIIKPNYDTLDVLIDKISLDGGKIFTTVMPDVLWVSEEEFC